VRWIVWPRQYGKTYQIEQWWLENPQNRAIVTANEELARLIRTSLGRELARTGHGLFKDEIKRLLDRRVMSWRSWGNTRGEAWRMTAEVAVDEAGAVLQAMLSANVTVIAGSGKNDEPDHERAAQISAFNFSRGMDPDE
jgi:hypothetical protein